MRFAYKRKQKYEIGMGPKQKERNENRKTKIRNIFWSLGYPIFQSKHAANKK